MKNWKLGAAGIVVAVAVWWLVTSVIARPDSLLSAFGPQHAIPAIGDLAAQGVLAEDVLTSLFRLLAGLLIAAVLGLVLGIAVGSIPELDAATRPVFQFLRMVSPLSWAPVAIGLFGIGHRPVYFLVAAAAIWPIVLNTAQGVRSIDRGFLLVARSLGAGRTETLTSVALPAIRPHLLTGFRLALGIAWVVLVPAEMLGVTSGLGYEILNSRDQLAYDKVMAVILVIGVLGYLLDVLARWIFTPRNRRQGTDGTGSPKRLRTGGPTLGKDLVR
ncbi:ABC transporter permease [Amycolatopsis taiwanensis]|uniref:ABC transporter permease n=1 Tax=Amycolatopsis taiwanensis TaxID=342230 RepID=A0A9W6VL57_9PSEU|nr:ABC transporter permease [Amycolatopsis taiwanensis]GLY71122.1 ABC transporter permease [Amycolatopsis taiwanensis]